MLAVGNGDEDAFAQLFERHMPGVVNAFWHYTHDRAAAEDLAQEAFIRLFKARERYTPEARFTTWLYRIVNNLGLNWRRDQKHRRALSLSSPLEGVNDTDPILQQPEDEEATDPHLRVASNEMAAVVAGAIDRLPDTQRMALVLSRYQMMSCQEIGDAMEMSADAVKSLLARARGSLRDVLAPWWNRLERESLGE